MTASALIAALLSVAQALVASTHQEPPPAALADGIRSRLQPAGVTVTHADTRLEFWWVNGVVAGAPGPGWSNVENGTLVGALRVTGDFKEVRGKTVKPGVYTLRFGLQPQNGDHLGISPYREFLLLSPAAADRDPKILGFDGVVEISKLTIGTSHPASFSIDPPEDAPGAPLSVYKSEYGYDGVVFEVKQGGKANETIKFGLILVGVIVH